MKTVKYVKEDNSIVGLKKWEGNDSNISMIFNHYQVEIFEKTFPELTNNEKVTISDSRYLELEGFVNQNNAVFF